MATSVENQGLHIDPKELECSICLELLDDPRTLPCGHWFCGPSKDCLKGQTFSSGAIECAICRKLHTDIVIQDLPPNYALRSILETLRNQSETPATPVTRCKPNLLDFNDQTADCPSHKGNSLSYHCEECEQVLCQSCWADHDSEHKVVLVQLKRKKLLSELLESFGFENTIEHYKKLLDDNNRRKAILRDLVKHADRLFSHLSARSQQVETLQKMADDLKNKSTTCDEKFCKDLLEKLTKESEGGDDSQIKSSFQAFKTDCEGKYLSLMNTFVSSEKILAEQASESSGAAKKKNQNQSKKRPEEKCSLERDLKSAMKSGSGSKSGDGNNKNSSNERPATSRAAPVSTMFLSPDVRSDDEFEDDNEEEDDVSETGSAVSTSVLNSGDGNRRAAGNRRGSRRPRASYPRSGGQTRSDVGVIRGTAPAPRGGPRFPRGNSNVGPRMPPPPLFPQNAAGPRMRPPPPPRPLIPTDVPIRINGCLVFRRGNLLDSQYSLAIGVRENADFDVGLPLAIGKKFRPIPDMFKRAKKRPGQVFVFEDSRITPKRFIYCLVIKEQNWVGKPYSAVLENCFHAVKEHAQKNHIDNISMPLIGHAHGDDLSVDLVELILKNIFSPNITINIYN